MDLEWAKKVGLEPAPLQNPITMYNVDGTQNRDGKIWFGMDLLVRVGDHQEQIHFLLRKTQSHMVILGHDWLKRHNPEIDWAKAEVKLSHCPKTCSSPPHCCLTPPKVSTLASASILDTCYNTIQLHQHVLHSRLQNLHQSWPSPICSVTTLHTPLHTPLGLCPIILQTPWTFI